VTLECPACGAEHGAGERFCRDCGLPLVFAPGAAPPPKAGAAAERARKVRPSYTQGRLVRVATARHQAEAELIQNLLLEEGIPSLVRRTGGFDVPDFLASGPRDVLVRESGAEAAREALGGVAASDEDPGGAPTRADALSDAPMPAAAPRDARGERPPAAAPRHARGERPPWLRALAVAIAVLLLAAAAAGVLAALPH
jgi:hypothetical protein